MSKFNELAKEYIAQTTSSEGMQPSVATMERPQSFSAEPAPTELQPMAGKTFNDLAKEYVRGLAKQESLSQPDPVEDKIGFWENIDRGGWGGFFDRATLGVKPLVETASLYGSVKRLQAKMYDTGSISKEEKEADENKVINYLKEKAEEQERGLTVAAKIGNVVADIAPFVVEFVATGGLAALGKKAVTKGVLKLTSEIIRREATQQVGRFTARKATAKLAGWATAGAIRTALTPHRIIKNYIDLRMPDIQISPEGQMIFKESGNKPFTAAYKAIGNQWVQMASEETGTLLGKVAGGATRKVLPKAVVAAMESLKTAWVGIRGGRTALDFAKKIGTYTGRQGILEEMGEERLGDLMTAALGLRDDRTDTRSKFEQIGAALYPGAEQLFIEAVAFSVPAGAQLGVAKAMGGGEKTTYSRRDMVRMFGIKQQSSKAERQALWDEHHPKAQEEVAEPPEAEPVPMQADEMPEGEFRAKPEEPTTPEITSQPSQVQQMFNEQQTKKTTPIVEKTQPADYSETITGQIEALKKQGRNLVEQSRTPEGVKGSEDIADQLDKLDLQIQKLEGLKEKLVGNDPKFIAKKAGVKLHNPSNKTQSIYQLLGVEKYYLAGQKGIIVDEALTGNETELQKQAYNYGLKDRVGTKPAPLKVKVKSRGIKVPTKAISQAQQAAGAVVTPATTEGGTQEIGVLQDTNKYPHLEIPVKDLKLSKDVPNFKKEADTVTGVIKGQELQGPYVRLGTGTIVVWKRNNGDMEVITGRHRFRHAQKTGEKTIPAQIVKESEGFTIEKALVLDAEANIKDNQGSTKDYVNYFRNIKITEQEARARGLLRNAKGNTGFLIGRSAVDDVYAGFLNGKIPESKAAAIAKGAPNNEAVQVAVLTKAGRMSADELEQFAKILARTPPTKKMKQGDLFGYDDSVIVDAKAVGKEVSKESNQIRDRILSVRGALARPETAKKMGLGFSDEPSLRKEVERLENRLDELSRADTNPKIYAEMRQRAGLEPTKQIDLLGQEIKPESTSGLSPKATQKVAWEPSDFKTFSESEKTNAEADLEGQGTLSTKEGKIAEVKPKPEPKRILASREEFEKARKNLLGGGLFVGIDPSKFKDLTIVGAYHLESLIIAAKSGAIKFADWSKVMIEDLGDRVKKHLDAIWAELHKPIEVTKPAKAVKEKQFSQTDIEQAKRLILRSAEKRGELIVEEKPVTAEQVKSQSVLAREMADNFRMENRIFNLEYTEMSINEQVEQVHKFITEHPEKAVRIDEGGENNTGIKTSAIKAGLFFQAKANKNWDEAQKFAENSFAYNLELGQEVAVLKGMITENSPLQWYSILKTNLIDANFKPLKKGLKTVKSAAKVAQETVQKRTTKAKAEMTKQQLNLQKALNFIESLRCNE